MKFDVYFPFKNKEGKTCPGIRPRPMDIAHIKELTGQKWVSELIEEIRNGNKALKVELPAVCYTGTCHEKRSQASAQPTGWVMVDFDHVKDVQEVWKALLDKIGKFNDPEEPLVVGLAHCTPSMGLRVVFKARKGIKSLSENMEWFKRMFVEDWMGDFDTAVKDYSRISFLATFMDFLWISEEALNKEADPVDLVNELYEAKEEGGGQPSKKKAGEIFDKEEVEVFTDDEKAAFEKLEYKGTPVKVIIKKYVEVCGQPSSGEIHPYYNEMVKNFRLITDNNKRALLYLLPRFGHTLEECASQIKSICRVNTLSSLPKTFYFFLKDNGFYTSNRFKEGALKEYMMKEEDDATVMPPYLPPVFRELVGTAPKDFVLPCVNALLPILGTLTSFAQARYPYDDRLHTTSFFSVIYAPPGTGKGFVERFMDLLFEDLKLRDFIQSERENIYLRTLQRKGANDKAPDAPHTSLRLIPAKNSEAEFLQKQRDNHGYHMFTYAAEMDSWAKGVRAAGGNKDDMIRIAWDNGEYGQQFKSFNTFKGTVNLYWNVLITGTLQQLEMYFKNVENGLVSRCSFTSIDNQEFAAPPKWKTLSDKSRQRIREFTKFCDEMTYKSPCTLVPDELAGISDDEFDKEVDWHFEFNPKRLYDLSWIMPTIEEFHKVQMAMAAKDIDKARDVFRRRVGVRGFRLALICNCLWKNPRKRDLEKCKSFVRWFMEEDIKNILKLWGQKYNEQADDTPKLVQRTVFNELPKDFSRNDVYVVCTKQGIKTPIRRIIFDWKKLGYIKQRDKENFEKV